MAILKKQVYITVELDARLKRLARQTGRSESEVVREALAAYVTTADDPFDAIIGLDAAEGPDDLAANHDRYLYGSEDG